MNNLLVKALDKDRFQQWLESHQSNVVVGHPRRSISCPLAWYLMKSDIFNYAAVGSTEVHAEIRTTEKIVSFYSNRGVDLPDWVTDFVSNVDVNYSGNITASQALEVLRKL